MQMKMSDTNLDSAKVAIQAIESAHKHDLAKGQSSEYLKLKSLAPHQLLPQPINLQLHAIELLQQQSEYYFSRRNLTKDGYLLSQMDSQQYVATKIIENCNAIKKLTSDIELVVKALRGSSMVEVDEGGEKLRPKKRRYTVILREIPDIANGSHVMGIFDGGPVKCSSCEFAGNGNWCIFFETKDDARAACRYLREIGRDFILKQTMAQIDPGTLHLNTYGYHLPQQTHQNQGTLYPIANPFTHNNGGYTTPQVTSTPLEYFDPQKVLLCPQPPFTTAANSNVAFPPFLTQMAIPNVATMTCDEAALHLAAANSSLNRFPIAPACQGANIYPPQAPQHPSTMRTPQVTQQSLQLQHDSIHPPQYHRRHADNNKFANAATNRNMQNQYKVPPGFQQQLPHSSMTRPPCIPSTDRIHPKLIVLPQYVQSQPITARRGDSKQQFQATSQSTSSTSSAYKSERCNDNFKTNARR